MPRALTVLAIVLVLLAGARPAVAASGLRTVGLQASDAPPGFSGLRTKVFLHYKRVLKLKVGKGTASCKVLPQLKAGWRQGMLQEFRGPSFLSVFELCGFLQGAAAQAHVAYTSDVAQLEKAVTKTTGLTVTNPSIGNEAIEIGGAQSGFATFEMVFRRDNALIELVYLGSSSYTQSAFTSTGTAIDSRIQSS
jgi:hypothetical protein